MKKFWEIGRHIQWAEFEDGKIIDFSCSCEDFMYRRLGKDGDKTILFGICKHLNVAFNVFNKFKIKDGIIREKKKAIK